MPSTPPTPDYMASPSQDSYFGSPQGHKSQYMPPGSPQENYYGRPSPSMSAEPAQDSYFSRPPGQSSDFNGQPKGDSTQELREIFLHIQGEMDRANKLLGPSSSVGGFRNSSPMQSDHIPTMFPTPSSPANSAAHPLARSPSQSSYEGMHAPVPRLPRMHRGSNGQFTSF